MASWIGDLERCVAWTWLAGKQESRAPCPGQATCLAHLNRQVGLLRHFEELAAVGYGYIEQPGNFAQMLHTE